MGHRAELDPQDAPHDPDLIAVADIRSGGLWFTVRVQDTVTVDTSSAGHPCWGEAERSAGDVLAEQAAIYAAVDAMRDAGDSVGLELTGADLEMLLRAALPHLTGRANDIEAGGDL